MVFQQARSHVARVFSQRCFYLFFSVLLLVTLGPLATHNVTGRIAVEVINGCLLISAIAAVGRTRLSFVIALLLAASNVGFEILATRFDMPQYSVVAVAFGAAFYVTAITYLLGYVFRREVMTEDKLYGAAAAYLMTGVLWVYLYGLVQHLIPGSFSSAGKQELGVSDLVYYSFSVLTSAGFGDIVPVSPLARSVTTLEAIAGMLFVAILIARLAGIYPPRRQEQA